jgi:MFS family permease
VPAANGIGQAFGWRWGFAIVAGLALVTIGLVALFAPHDRPHEGASAMRELSALGKRQVWLTLFIGVIGFGGLFSVYTYLASTLLNVTKVSPHVVPLVLAVFGVGLTAGNMIVPRYVHHGLMRVTGWLLLFSRRWRRRSTIRRSTPPTRSAPCSAARRSARAMAGPRPGWSVPGSRSVGCWSGRWRCGMRGAASGSRP